jgi:phosphopantothenoylcysteine decarboxylase/phosphopantothenate--cysteine ligase
LRGEIAMAGVFAGKKIVVGVTGSIAAFKVAGWVSELSKQEAQVSVILTEAAKKFVAPLTFASLSGNKVYQDMFAESEDEVMAHIDLGRDADVILIAPATANTIAKLAYGLADNLLSATVLASRARIVVCPAMNPRMYSHPLTQQNITRLKELGYLVINPAAGLMACKEVGDGRLVEWSEVVDIVGKCVCKQDLAGKTVLVTAGPTREPVDPARYLSNRSSGKMGYALARTCYRRGAEVIFITGPSALPLPAGGQCIPVQTAEEMYDAVLANSAAADIIIKAAAVADYRPAVCARHKEKKENIGSELTLVRNPDILKELGRRKRAGQILVGFAAESQHYGEEGQRKLREKNLDLIAVNDIGGENTGFAVDTNQLLLITSERQEMLPLTSKDHVAELLVDRIIGLMTKASE